MAPVLKKSPKKLERLARRVVNEHVHTETKIFDLPIPKVLQRKCGSTYLKDKFMCTESIAPLEEDDINQWFEEPFVKISNDEWLTIQSWCYGVPHWAFDKNHIRLIYFTEKNGSDRFCWDCIHTKYSSREKNVVIQKWTECDFATGEELIDHMQCLSMWCNYCCTTSLFYIEDYPWRSQHIWCCREQLSEVTL